MQSIPVIINVFLSLNLTISGAFGYFLTLRMEVSVIISTYKINNLLQLYRVTAVTVGFFFWVMLAKAVGLA